MFELSLFIWRNTHPLRWSWQATFKPHLSSPHYLLTSQNKSMGDPLACLTYRSASPILPALYTCTKHVQLVLDRTGVGQKMKIWSK